jgi:hypothetical protein
VAKYNVKYNTGSVIAGTTQSNNLAIATGSPDYSIAGWAAGISDEGAYLFISISTDLPVAGRSTGGNTGTMSVGQPVWWKTNDRTDAEVLRVINTLPLRPQNYTSAATALAWIRTSIYYTVYPIGSLSFNGSSQYLSFTTNTGYKIPSSTTPYTVEMFLKPAATVSQFGLTGNDQGTGTTGGLNLYLGTATTLQLNRNGGGGGERQYTFASPGISSTSTWYHLALTRNSSGVESAFLNGVKATACAGGTSISGGQQVNGLDYNGWVNWVGRFYGGYFRGQITNFRAVIGSNVYSPTAASITVPIAPLTSITDTKYLMLGAVITTDSSGTQTVTNNGGVTIVEATPFS